MHEDILIKNGTLVLAGGAERADLLISGGKIEKIGTGISEEGKKIVDASGSWVGPGFVDLHCHLREPGYEYKEDIASGARAAAKGGFTTVCCMANTKPVNDDPAITEYIINRSKKAGGARVLPIAALTMGLKGEQLTEAGLLAQAGAVALSDDGASVRDANKMRLGLSYAKRFGLKVISHPEDMDLTNGGVMNEGYWSSFLGLPGTTRAAEETIIYRDCAIAEIEKTSIHIAHVSTRRGAEIVRFMKDRGVQVTAETTPHYIYGTDELAKSYEAVAKVNPPLRTPDDRTALIEALLDGTIDCIATDHAPHHADEKNVEFALAMSGISGFETALGICWTVLVKGGHMSPCELFEKMSAAPAKILELDAGEIKEGAPADVVIVAPDQSWTVDPSKFISKGKNTPFAGDELTGSVDMTIVGGVVVYEKDR